MKQHHKSGAARRGICILLAALLCVSLVMPSVGAVTQADIDKLKDQASSLNQKKSDLKEKLAALSEDKDEAMERKNVLDE